MGWNVCVCSHDVLAQGLRQERLKGAYRTEYVVACVSSCPIWGCRELGP